MVRERWHKAPPSELRQESGAQPPAGSRGGAPGGGLGGRSPPENFWKNGTLEAILAIGISEIIANLHDEYKTLQEQIANRSVEYSRVLKGRVTSSL